MLSQINIKKFLYITDISLNLSPKLNVFTGETGVGKSLIVDAISFVLGEKGKINEGDFVELVFDNIKNEFSEDETLIVAREIRNGKSIYFLNGRRATLSTVKEATKDIIEIHSQHHQQKLFSTDYHREIIDNFAEINQLLFEFKNKFLKLKQIQKEEKKLREEQSNRLRELDILQYQLQELEELNLQEGEKEQLEQEYNYLSNIQSVKQIVSESLILLNENENSTLDNLGLIIKNLTKISEVSPEIEKVVEELEEAKAIVENVSHSLNNLDTEVDVTKLHEIEERLNQINRLEKKYNVNFEELLKLENEFKERINYLQNMEFMLPEIEKEREKLQKEVEILSEKISKIRKQKSVNFDKKVQKHLNELALKDSIFKTEIKEKNMDKFGKDKVQFLFSGNKGFEPTPINETASGGEISRISLAVKLVSKNSVESIIFDEIDTGIGGKTALKMAKKLKNLSNYFQVILITHLPQIAVLSDKHFYIEKEFIEGKTVAKVSEIRGYDKEKEIARMLSGIVNEKSIKFAKELISEVE